ncbi:Rossmann-like and DUF2520 domain-containing protein [Desulforamulus hydrothermalis]|uniref:DUF2520 domain-containing protein n=1 Tax=Desulforamulus hydrothermalis Lam5 = DSM 18033 TaxID=1121428 RepID=K8DZZ3_9FIRM|nr:DUF2520 domain-containing protein [Desulforamulus hydrothermalis]CCO08675.1 conserved hypothetical protein [Desulforamulus hydrothermalis Lam5 = DSM 18033]SHH38791.1 Predicted oxidoreductase, contains short-chain dehydrogenase (SDR) and DUF2520 domains [Desulforamulus hydrothermalis Lam5 = DSM 18033]
MDRKPSFSIIGAGKVGSALGVLLQELGYLPAAVYSRTFSHSKRLADQLQVAAAPHPAAAAAAAELVFITTTDREIAAMAAAIARQGGCRPGQIVFHASGALASDVLAPVRAQGAWAVSMHPLQSFTSTAGARANLPGSCFALEGDEPALERAIEIVKDLKGRYFVIQPEDKPLYHAAAVIASNYLVSLVHLSASIYRQLGLDEEQAMDALFPLIQGTINNIARSGPAGALTGPVARADGATLRGHLRALQKMDWRTQQAYRAMGLYTVGVAMENGNLTPNEAVAISNIFLEVDNHEQKSNYSRLPAYETGRHPHYHANRLRLSDGHLGRCFRYRRHPGGGLPR